MTDDVLDAITRMLDRARFHPEIATGRSASTASAASTEKPNDLNVNGRNGRSGRPKQEKHNEHEATAAADYSATAEALASRSVSLLSTSIPSIPSTDEKPAETLEFVAKKWAKFHPTVDTTRQTQLQDDWHLAHGERISRDLCAGCRRPIRPDDEILDLADDNRVHFPHGDDSYTCLVQHGERWRKTARHALKEPA
jgi:hypothetical protein